MSLVLPSLIGANKPASGSALISNDLSANFDGTDDTLNCTIPSTLMATDFTTSIWVRFPGTPGDVADGAIWANNYYTSGKTGWRLYFDSLDADGNGNLSVWASNGSLALDNPIANVSVALGNNTWSHIAWGRNSGSHFLYVNGSSVSFSQGLQQFNSSTTSYSLTPALKIFSPDVGTGPNTGQCDEASIWDSALTSAQITNIYKGEISGGSGGTNGIAGDLSTFAPEIWWRMGDGTGDTNSSSGAPANGGIIGTILNQGSLASSNSVAGVNGTQFSNLVPA